jgi:dihydrofolate reductase
MTIISIIAAMSINRVIGDNNAMPWHIPEELKHFKSLTMGKPMIMGRKTFDSIGRRLLPGRRTIILTRDQDLIPAGFDVAHSVNEALQIAAAASEVMVVGGAGVYAQFLPLAQRMYLSYIPQEMPGDAYFPEFDLKQWHKISEQQYPKFTAVVYEHI